MAERSTDDSAAARRGVLQLLDFLAAYDALRHPPVRTIDEYGLYRLRSERFPRVDGVRLTPGGESWLTVEFVDLPARPACPPELEAVLGPPKEIVPDRPPALPVLADDATEHDMALLAAANEWIDTAWKSWAQRHREALVVKGLHRDLFEQRELMATARETYELVWGFRRVRWQPSDEESVDHPLLTVPVEVDLDETTNALSVRPASAVEVEALYLAGLPLVDRARFNTIRSSVATDEGATDPWDAEATTELARRLVRSISHDGALVGEGAIGPNAASVDEGWVLFVRRRRPDYQGFLDGLKTAYVEGATPPDPLLALVVDDPSTVGLRRQRSEHDGVGAETHVGPLLLPLPTNEEQQRILERAEHRVGVTVQGPPGTGKSHTIANMISHYVAYGRRVLVVAEKEQALRVLREKIPAGIRQLTVSVLGADEDSRRNLESTIKAIQTRVGSMDTAHVDSEIDRLTKELDEVDRAIAATTDQLFRARRSELEHLAGNWFAGANVAPTVAAGWVAAHAGRLGYIDDELQPETRLPVDVEQFESYLRLLDNPGPTWAALALQSLPPAGSLPASRDLRAARMRLVELRAVLQTAEPALRSWERVDASSPELLGALRDAVAEEVDWLDKTAGGWLERVRDQLVDATLANEWQQFSAEAATARNELIVLGRPLEAHRIDMPDIAEPVLRRHLVEARQHLVEKGKLGVFARDAKRAVELFKIDGRAPSTAADVELCLAAIEQAEGRRQFSTRWANRMERVDGPELTETNPEEAAGLHLDGLARTLGFIERWRHLQEALHSIELLSPANATPEDLSRLVSVLEAVAHRSEERAVSRWLVDLRAWLTAGAAAPDAAPLWRQLIDALDSADDPGWDRCISVLGYLHNIKPHSLLLRELGQRMRSASPRWAQRIDEDRSAAGAPQDLIAAWQWRQLETWLAHIRAAGDPAVLQAKITALTSQRRNVISSLVEARAWRLMSDRLGDRERLALNRYVDAMKRYGKTGGKYAPRWIGEMRDAMDGAKGAVPVWIMTTNRALSSFQASGVPPFDVLVVDEASQIGLDALPLLSLAKRTIVVGDDQQTSPENVGSDQARFHDLLEEHLRFIRGYRTLFDINASLYDLAKAKFPDVVMLTEHFRCLPPIIEFSNARYYDRRIVPLRDQLPRPGWRPLGAIKVVDGYRSGDRNEPEALAVVDLIQRLCDDPAYDGMDFGVISLTGSTQSRYIAELLQEALTPAVYEARRIRCGEPAIFQGDERNVIVLSTVVATDPDRPTGRIAAMTGVAAQRRMNVAASRACDQMWVVHSLDPDRFPAGDPRAELIRHCQAPERLSERLDQIEERCESDFERSVVRCILARGYTDVRVQEVVGRYRLDIVVHGPESRLAVECDGDRWHGEDEWHRDRARQTVLERAGWTFVRIRGSSFYRDSDNTLEPLWAKLEELRIPTGDEWRKGPPQTTVLTVSSAELADRRTAIAARDASAPERPEAERFPQEANIASAGSAPPEVHTLDGASPPPNPEHMLQVPSGSSPRQAPDAPLGNEHPLTPFHDDARETAYPPIGRVQESAQLLRPYRVYDGPSLPPISTASLDDVATGLARIVEAEGPMHAISAYQTYVRASGGHRVGKEMRSIFNRAAAHAVRRGLLRQLGDSIEGQAGKTLYVPGTEPVVLREPGPRALDQIPRSEVKTLIDVLGVNGSLDEVARAVLDALGFVRLTANARDHIGACTRYTWTVTR